MFKFHKEGAKIILASTTIAVIIIFALDFLVPEHYFWLKKSGQVAVLIFLVLILQFFRNPNREVTHPSDKTILAPVDGKVVVIEEVYEPEYFKDKRLMVSIFMSLIKVHVTVDELNGVVKYSKYHPGKYLVAWHQKVSEEKERTTVVIDNPEFGEVMYRQIAGALAKRIVNYAQEGQRVIQRSDAGFIKFGSRVDLYLPLGTPVEVALKQTAKGNRTLIAKK